jgi:threonyl-tRNA synthetase
MPENQSVALRSRKEGELGEVPLDAVVEKLNKEVKMKAL